MNLYRLSALSAALLVALAGQSLIGQSQPSPAPAAGPFDGLHFRPIGPASMSGRISDIAAYEANPAIFYVGTAHGGVWKTVNNGTTFEAQFQDLGLMSIGDIAISQNNPDLVYVGSGESNNRQSTSWGDGMYKTTDGGKTWKQTLKGDDDTGANDLVIDPNNNKILYASMYQRRRTACC